MVDLIGRGQNGVALNSLFALYHKMLYTLTLVKNRIYTQPRIFSVSRLYSCKMDHGQLVRKY